MRVVDKKSELKYRYISLHDYKHRGGERFLLFIMDRWNYTYNTLLTK